MWRKVYRFFTCKRYQEAYSEIINLYPQDFPTKHKYYYTALITSAEYYKTLPKNTAQSDQVYSFAINCGWEYLTPVAKVKGVCVYDEYVVEVLNILKHLYQKSNDNSGVGSVELAAKLFSKAKRRQRNLIATLYD